MIHSTRIQLEGRAAVRLLFAVAPITLSLLLGGLGGCARAANGSGDDPVCGNNEVEIGEECDDGNTTAGDGCSATCLLETPVVCGNGLIDVGEECDDGNAASGDGCSATCLLETPAGCGDGTVDAGEECDDGNTTAGDGCSAACRSEYCGDGVVQAGLGEECDDGGTTPGDGCDAACQDEYCGDGVVQAGLGEECDDGGTTSGDGCDAACLDEPGVVCGNGARETGEACDDGNTTGGDGCSASCQLDTLLLAPDAASGKDAAVFDRDTAAMATNYGDSAYLYAMVWTWGGDDGTYRSLLEFPLPSAMQGCTVGTATLSLFHYPGTDHSALSGANDYQIQRITTTWDEHTVTWNNQPSSDAGSTISVPAPASITANAQIDVTSIVSYWFANAGSNHGFLIRLANENYYRAVAFTSSDHTDPSLHPTLSVTFTSCP
ncbi:MAG: DNRLRE domain-containing protein [bacterium]